MVVNEYVVVGCRAGIGRAEIGGRGVVREWEFLRPTGILVGCLISLSTQPQHVDDAQSPIIPSPPCFIYQPSQQYLGARCQIRP